MKKIFRNMTVVYLILSIMILSCSKPKPSTSFVTKTSVQELPTIKKNRIWQYIVAVVIIVLAETSGQRSSTTTTTQTTDAHGNTTTTTTTKTSCDGLGTCAMGMATQPDGGGNLNTDDQSFNLHTDLKLNAKLATTQSNDIILLVEDGQNSAEITQRFFYGDYIYFLSESYTVNNPTVLSSLGLTSPLVIRAANYPVYQQENMKYIIVGHKS